VVDGAVFCPLLYPHDDQIGNRALSANKQKDAPNEKAGFVPAFYFCDAHGSGPRIPEPPLEMAADA
jgi:hypothetical protein